eukprot:RCo043494
MRTHVPMDMHMDSVLWPVFAGCRVCTKRPELLLSSLNEVSPPSPPPSRGPFPLYCTLPVLLFGNPGCMNVLVVWLFGDLRRFSGRSFRTNSGRCCQADVN